MLAHKEKMTASGELATPGEQQVKWMWTMLEERLIARLRSDPRCAPSCVRRRPRSPQTGADAAVKRSQYFGGDSLFPPVVMGKLEFGAF